MAGSTGPKTVVGGLLLGIDSKNPQSYPGSGNTFYDISGNGYSGTMLNGMSVSNKRFNFDDTNDYGYIVNDTRLDVTSEFSITLWMRVNSFATHGQIVAKGSGLGGVNNGWALSMATSQRIYLDTYTVDTRYPLIPFYTSANGITDQFGWNFVSATFKSYSARKIYFNGNEVASAAADFEIAGTNRYNFQISGPSSWRPMNGEISQILYYNRELTAAEILQNYNQTKSRFI
jgi:hypothetical protein